MVSAWQKDENAPTLVKTSTERTLVEQTFFANMPWLMAACLFMSDHRILRLTALKKIMDIREGR